MQKESIGRLDTNSELRKKILPLCRLEKGEIWEDSVSGHKVGVLDATLYEDVTKIMGDEKANLSINDPPYNVRVGNKETDNLFRISLNKYMEFSRKWVKNTVDVLGKDAHFYVWLGADQNAGFQPLPDFILMMRDFEQLKSRSLITMRNQRGYGTQKNWMAVRQELLYYTKGNPTFSVVYTDIPKILRGYYKKVNGIITENMERSKSNNIRASNVWVDIQQVFYRMEENVPGAYAQKPMKSIERIIRSSSNEKELIVDFFSHSGTTLLAAEILNRKCYTFDIAPIFAELTIRRLEYFRKTGKLGWQFKNPFPEIQIPVSTGKDKYSETGKENLIAQPTLFG
ncbi:site-specific DNA-methyltransferase [bacterium]|nr:site-specific DNA-methyltransferase [bacterium]